MRIAPVAVDDLEDLVPLVEAYCEFYGASPGVFALRELCEELLVHPDDGGFQLLARDDHNEPLGFATVYWSWSTLRAARIAVLNDLFVTPTARRSGTALALIQEAQGRARAGGAVSLQWDTRRDNLPAQRLYERAGADRSDDWIDYWLDL